MVSKFCLWLGIIFTERVYKSRSSTFLERLLRCLLLRLKFPSMNRGNQSLHVVSDKSLSPYASTRKRWDLKSYLMELKQKSKASPIWPFSEVNLNMIAGVKIYFIAQMFWGYALIFLEMCSTNRNANWWGLGSLIYSRTSSASEQRVPDYTPGTWSSLYVSNVHSVRFWVLIKKKDFGTFQHRAKHYQNLGEF